MHILAGHDGLLWTQDRPAACCTPAFHCLSELSKDVLDAQSPPKYACPMLQAQKQRGRGSPQAPVQIELQQMTSPPRDPPGAPTLPVGLASLSPNGQHAAILDQAAADLGGSMDRLTAASLQVCLDPAKAHDAATPHTCVPARQWPAGPTQGAAWCWWPLVSSLHVLCSTRPPMCPLAAFLALVGVM